MKSNTRWAAANSQLRDTMSLDAAMRVEPATPVDLPVVRAAYADARTIQREQNAIVWPEFTDAAILGEIDAGNLFRIVAADSTAGVFTVAYEDAAIWGEQERGAHIYLHRLARVSGYRGRLLDAVLMWARAQCHQLGRAGIRIDTWASNAALIAYYQRCGFDLVGQRRLATNPGLPPHYYDGIELALLEQRCGGDAASNH